MKKHSKMVSQRDIRAVADALLVLLLLFSWRGSAVAGGESDKEAPNPNHAETKSGDSSVAIPFDLFERLLGDMKPANTGKLFDYLQIGHGEQEKIHPAFREAEKAAREKQRALSTTGGGKIVLKAGTPVTIQNLGEKAIEGCVAVFTKSIDIDISNNTRRVLCAWVRSSLKKNFSDKFTVELLTPDTTLPLPDDRPVEPRLEGATPPVKLGKYYLRIRILSDGRPICDWMLEPQSTIMEGQRYDFLTFDAANEAAKPLEEKSKEAPAK